MRERGVYFLLLTTCLFQLQSAKAADQCADAIKPSNEIAGCKWKEGTDANNCKTYTAECGPDAKIDKGCLQDSDNGPCFAHITRYYYNARVGKCSPFVFGGCSANSNNFNSLAECTSVCINNQPRKTPDVPAPVNNAVETLNCTGVNEQYYGCGACDSNCNSTSKTVCSLICRPAECGCIDGYVRNANKVCVAPDKCKDPVGPINLDPNAGSEDIKVTQPPPPTTTQSTTRTTPTSTTRLPPSTLATLLTERPSTAFTLHPPMSSTSKTTSKPKQPLCSLIVCPSKYTCQNGTCIPPSGLKCDKLRLAIAADGCKHAFRNDSNGCSLPYLVCSNMTCAQNEEAKLCGACDGNCGSPVCIPAEQCRKPSCGCWTGYVRNKANKCVPKAECSGQQSTNKPNQTTPTSTAKPLASPTPSFAVFHNKLINSNYIGLGPVRMTSQNTN